MFKLDLSYLVGKYEKKLKDWINESLEDLKSGIDPITAYDTWRLFRNNKINKASWSWEIEWSLENKTPYAWKVEFWEGFVYNYHRRDRSVFHTWVWTWSWRRTFDEEEDNIKTIIKNKLKLW